MASTEAQISGDILIVDDTPANLRLLSEMLSEHGHKVRLAPSGKLALMAAQAAPPNLILLDIKMPGLNGYEVCEQLKADPRTRDIPVIFLSALDQTEDKVEAFTSGGVDYITKPFQFEEVLARVKTHLDLYALQRRLTAANRELEASNADLEAFAHTVAHDLQSPLAIILGFSELLQTSAAEMTPEQLARSLSNIASTARKMSGIVDALLLFARVRQADGIEREQLDMGTIVGEVLARLAPEIEAAHAEITAPETWPAVWGYAPWIEEVWVNYLSNALKYGGDVQNGSPPEIEIACEVEGETGCRFTVRDNGPGLSPEEQAKVFVPFTRFHQTRAQGHGLGLSIVERIVEKLGGQVGVDSAGAGQGCRFWFVLPSTV